MTKNHRGPNKKEHKRKFEWDKKTPSLKAGFAFEATDRPARPFGNKNSLNSKGVRCWCYLCSSSHRYQEKCFVRRR